MMVTDERIGALRACMKASGLAAYVVPTADPHMSEYPPEHWEARAWFSGFDGSAGTLVVTAEHSDLWVDGRYFLQADRQTEGTEVRVRRSGVKGVPTYHEYLTETLGEGDVAGFDGTLLSAATVKKLENALKKKGATVRSAELLSAAWGAERPAMPATQVFVHSERYAGFSCEEKLEQVREELKKADADATVVARLDCVAWLTNLRASDIEYNPFAVAYAVIYGDRADLFINAARLTRPVVEYLFENGVTLRPYEEVTASLARIDVATTVLYDPNGVNDDLYRTLANNKNITLKKGADVVTNLKGVKNKVEIKNIIHAHVKDARALVRFKVELEERMAAGEAVTECDVGEMLHRYRSEEDGCMGESFGTIAAYRANAAMMHYNAVPGSCATLKNEGFLLVDSGAQYLDGTTDVTRTFVMGPCTEAERTHYTYVLQAHIALARARFLEGCTGGNVDIFAREPLWRHGLDYRCGTGHGVGFLGGVHEGPQDMRISNRVELKCGMTITDEPGFYAEGAYGIRTENELLVVEKMDTEYGKFLGFQPITYFPIDTEAIVPGVLNADETAWLNTYHGEVLRKLAPLLDEKHLAWLKERTKAI